MSANNGGPAFPQPILDTKGKSGIVASEELDFGGMTLRDYFAAKALPAIVSTYVEANGRCIGTDHFPRNCAIHAYNLADAMLKARKP